MDFVFTLNGVIKKKLGCKRQVIFSTVDCFFASIWFPSLFPCQPFRNYLPLPLPYPSPLCILSHSGVSRSQRARVRGERRSRKKRGQKPERRKNKRLLWDLWFGDLPLFTPPGCLHFCAGASSLLFPLEAHGSKINLKQGAHIHQPTAWPVPHACAQPYHPGSGSHGQLFRPYWGLSAWHSRPVNERGKSPSIKDPLLQRRVQALL